MVHVHVAYKSANMATTVLATVKSATFIFVCLLGTLTITLSAGSHLDPPYSRVFYITPNNKTIASTSNLDGQQIGSAIDEIFHSRGTTNFTFQEVLQNYERFFTSNTKLQLLPGIHEVSESFDSIIVKDIHNFAIVGASESCNSDYMSLSEIADQCSRVNCLESSSLGLAFLNSTNITVSKFQWSKCDAPTEQLENTLSHNRHDYSTLHWYDNPLLLFVNSVCNHKYMILAAFSGNFRVKNMAFEHPTTACFTAIGITTLTIQYSIFQSTKCAILTLDKRNPDLDQFYKLSDLMFMPSHKNFSSYALYIEFHQVYNYVEVFLERSTFQNQSLRFHYYGEACSQREFIPFMYKVAVQINKLVVLGNQESCHGLVVDKISLDTTCYDEKNFQATFGISNSHFIRSNIDIVGCNTFESVNEIKLVANIHNVKIKQVPCSCDFALSGQCTVMDINFFTLTKSCCEYNLVTFYHNAMVGFHDRILFAHNNGTCISATTKSVVLFSGGLTTFSDNVSEKNSGSIVLLVNSILEVSGSETVLSFENNTGKSCGGIMAKENSTIIVRSFVQFINNSGYDGGALSLYGLSRVEYLYTLNVRALIFVGKLLLAKVHFNGNFAQHFGGAIFIAEESYEKIDDETTKKRLTCAFTLEQQFNKEKELTNVTTFINNRALYSGSAIYGGWIDICDHGKGVLQNSNLTASTDDPSVTSSNPTRVCICIESTPQCNITEYKIDPPLYPGQSFQIEAVAVGQRFGTTPAIVLATFVNNSIKVDELQKVQSVDKFCTSLNYTVKSPNENETLQLDVDTTLNNIEEPPTTMMMFVSNQTREDVKLLFKQTRVIIPLLPCPLGYEFERNLSSCVCKKELVKHGIECNTTTYTILRTSRQWINATFTHILNETNHGVLVHNHCPLDYCLNEDQFLNLENPSNQCNFERSGILCGSCQQNLSHIFGSNKCKKCSSLWAILVIPVFILLGLGLVALIILLNLTVAEGTVNALIFYVNIVSANQATFFPIETTNTFFRWFIAWLNLDIGVETCFISGLGAYTKTWLQFLFPFYIWFLVIVIIMASRRSTLAARLSGENAVQALGTLFLLSYTKLLRITITTFSSAQLVYPDGFTRRVWLYDGNVEFLEAKHAVLFVAALLLLVLISAPYTLVLLTIQWLQRLPYHFLLSWVWKLKPLFDAHTGPHKEKHRYWPGLLLLIRAILFVAFSLNFRNDPALNLLITSITSFCLLTYLAYLGGVYQTIYLDILEYIFLLNLGILSAATFYTRLTEGDQDKVIKTSVSIALFISLLIVLCHVYLKVKSTRHGSHFLHFLSETFKKACSPLTRALNRLGIVKTITRNNPFIGNSGTAARAKKTHTHSTIELKEPLLVEAKMA